MRWRITVTTETITYIYIYIYISSSSSFSASFLLRPAQLSRQRSGGLMLFGFSFFCDFCKPLIVHPVYLVSLYSSSDSGSSYDILDLADVANVFATSLPIPCRRMLPAMHFRVFISVAFSRRLAMVLSALVSMALVVQVSSSFLFFFFFFLIFL